MPGVPCRWGGEQGPDPKKQHSEKVPGEPRGRMWSPSYGIEAAAALTITGPGYRAIAKARTVPSVGSWHRPAGRGSVNTSEGGAPNALARCSLG